LYDQRRSQIRRAEQALQPSAFSALKQTDGYLPVIFDSAQVKFYFKYRPNDDTGVIDRIVVDKHERALYGHD
jgi:hypothetical protein